MHRLCALLLTATVLAGCSNAAGPPIEAPEWSPGHTWTYEWTIEASSSGFGGPSPNVAGEPQVITVVRPMQVDGVTGWLASQEADYLPFGSSSPFVFIENGTLTEHEFWNMAKYDCNGWDCGYVLNPRLYSEVGDSVFLDFPLRGGASWAYDDTDATYDARVQGTKAIGTPAGEFVTVHVHYAYSPSAQEIQAERQEMEEAGVIVHRFEFELSQVMDVYYSPAVENIVKQTMDFSVTFDVDLEFDDDRYREKGSATMTGSRVLQAYELAEVPAPTDAELLLSLGYTPLEVPDGEPPVGEPPVGGPADGSVVVAVTSDDVNVAEEGTVTLSAAATGAGGPFSHHWTVLHESESPWDHQPTTGATVTLEPMIGRYHYTVNTYDAQGKWVGTNSDFFDAFFEKEISGTCGRTVAAAGIVGECDDIEVYVDLWNAHWEIEGTLDGELRGAGELRLVGPNGYVLDKKTMDGGSAAIDTYKGSADGTYTVGIVPPDGLSDMPITLKLRVGTAMDR